MRSWAAPNLPSWRWRVRSHLALAVHRVPGRALVRLLNPILVEDGWSSRDTVVQGVKIFDERGAVSSEHRFLGVLASTALHEDVTRIPVINRRVLQVIRRAGVPLDSYSGQRMLEVLQTYPRAELFSADLDSLYETVNGVLSLTQRRALRLFCRHDLYTTAARLAMQDVLMRDLRGTGVGYSAQIGESVHARVHFIVRTDPGDSGVSTRPDVRAITGRLEDAVRTWEDRLLDAP